MEAILLGGATLAAVELALRLPLVPTISALLFRARRIVAVIRAPRISDAHKERVLPVYALRLAGLSLALLALLLAIASPFLLVGVVVFPGLNAFAAAMIDPWLLVLMLAIASGWLALRRRMRHGV
jgi:hypothetical protein